MLWKPEVVIETDWIDPYRPMFDGVRFSRWRKTIVKVRGRASCARRQVVRVDLSCSRNLNWWQSVCTVSNMDRDDGLSIFLRRYFSGGSTQEIVICWHFDGNLSSGHFLTFSSPKRLAHDDSTDLLTSIIRSDIDVSREQCCFHIALKCPLDVTRSSIRVSKRDREREREYFKF